MTPRRRDFLRLGAGVLAAPITGGLFGCAPNRARDGARADATRDPTPRANGYRQLLILVELKGGNDGLNTLVPYRDATYYALRPNLAIARDRVVQLSDRAGLHPALAPLLPFWERRELAVLRGLGYPAPNLSHFRSIEIWDTGSRSDQYLPTGWLTRTFTVAPTPSTFAADGFVIGSYDLGPLDGGARALTIGNPAQFAGLRVAASDRATEGPEALAHILRVESDIARAAARLQGDHAFATAFPAGAFGSAVRTACNVVAEAKDVAVVRITHNGYDTHANQAATQARLLGEFAQGLAALARGLDELGRYHDALILTYAEFGRRPHENLSGGTDHGTSSVHFALGGRVAGGLYGAEPGLAQLTSDGNLAYAIDFRSVYATALARWGVDATAVLGGRFAALPILRG
jgi:uncharacterized protein (DUF1501 family)